MLPKGPTISKGDDGLKKWPWLDQYPRSDQLSEFNLEKTIRSAISRASEQEENIKDKKIIENVLLRLFDSARSGELEDENIQTLILQVEAALKEG